MITHSELLLTTKYVYNKRTNMKPVKQINSTNTNNKGNHTKNRCHTLIRYL